MKNSFQPHSDQPAPLSLTEQLAAAINTDNKEWVAELIAKGASPNEPGMHGWSAMQRAAANGRVAILDLLLRAGGDAQRRTKLHQTLLHLAANACYPEIFPELIDAGLEVDMLDGFGQSALFYSADLNDAPGVAMLLALEANCQLRNQAGQTAYERALAREQDPVWKRSTADARAVLGKAGG